MKSDEKVEKLLSSDINRSDLDFIKSLKYQIKNGHVLSCRQIEVLNHIYKKYFIDVDKAKKNNKSLCRWS